MGSKRMEKQKWIWARRMRDMDEVIEGHYNDSARLSGLGLHKW
jgi:hypothetical protein